MYRAIKLGETENKQTQRKIITVQFEDVSIPHEFVKDFSFRLTDTPIIQRKIVGAYLDEINADTEKLPDGEIDTTVTPDVPVEPTPDEVAKTAWDLDVARLRKAQDLLDCGVTFSAPQLTALATLRGKVATDFKAEYLG